MPEKPPQGTASRRWARLVRARITQAERMLEGGGAIGAAFWDRRAARFAERTLGTEVRDPFLARVRPFVGRATAVIDAGSGPGRFTLALAPRAASVTAIDPSRSMLRILKGQARLRGISNIRTVESTWQAAAVEPAGVVICSYVISFIEDAAGFLAKLDAAALRRCFVYMSPGGIDPLLDPLWRFFHKDPRMPSPTYLDAAAVLEEIGIKPRVEIVEVPVRTRYRDIPEAVREHREHLLLDDSPAASKALQGLLETWLIRDRTGLRMPARTVPAAILSWSPRGRPRGTPRAAPVSAGSIQPGP